MIIKILLIFFLLYFDLHIIMRKSESNRIRKLNIARNYSLPTTQRSDDNANTVPNPFEIPLLKQKQPKNIFHVNNLEYAHFNGLQKAYNFIGLSQLKQCLKKTKKAIKMKKPMYGSMAMSMKSYTAKSNELQDFTLTKQQVFRVLGQVHIKNQAKSRNNDNNSNDRNTSNFKISERKQIQQLKLTSKQSVISRMKKQKQKKFRYSQHSRTNQILAKYQQKVDKLNQYTLHQKKQNINSRQWPNILRATYQLSDIYSKQENNLQTINRNGLLIKASSKKIKELQWIKQQNDNVLYQLIDKNNARKQQILKIRQNVQ